MWINDTTRLIFSCAVLGAGIVVAAAAAEKKTPVTEPAPQKLEQRVANLEQMLQNQGLLDMLQQLQALQAEIGKLRGQIEVNNHELEQLQEQQRSLYSDIDRRLQKLEGKSVPTTAPAAETPPLEVMTPMESVEAAGTEAETGLTVETVSPPDQATAPALEEQAGSAEQPLAPSVDPLEAQAEYQQAFSLLKQAQYDKAIGAFNDFLVQYPQSQYSENAQYWLGETYFVTRRYNEAITEYMKLLTNYPQSQKASNSLLKIGYSYYELKQDADARKVMQDVVQRYPGSTAAQDAEKRLQSSTAP
ncbi:MAG: tol-pal system protein YbgF [Gammaproteobacteria bacterium]